MVGFGFGIYCVPQRDRAVPAKEIVQYWCDLRILTASCQMYLHPRKIRSILWRLMSFILHIKLIKTYTTHDLNQKAEKGVPQLPDSSPNVPRTLCRPYLMGQHKVRQHSLANINEVYQISWAHAVFTWKQQGIPILTHLEHIYQWRLDLDHATIWPIHVDEHMSTGDAGFLFQWLA